jgi:hypothetical protein
MATIAADPRFRLARALLSGQCDTGDIDDGGGAAVAIVNGGKSPPSPSPQDEAIEIFAALLEESRAAFGDASPDAALCQFEYGNALFRVAVRRRPLLLLSEEEEEEEEENNEGRRGDGDDDDRKMPAAAAAKTKRGDDEGRRRGEVAAAAAMKRSAASSSTAAGDTAHRRPPSATLHQYTKKLKKETMPLNRKAMDVVEILNWRER